MANIDDLEILYQALHSPLGLVVRGPNFNTTQQRLYKARRESGDPELDRLQFRRSPFEPEHEVWVVKGQKESGNAET